MSEVIVVGVDNSETAKRAAVTAAKLATSLGAELHVISGFSDDRIEEFGSGSDRITVSSADSAEYVARKVSEELDIPSDSVKYYAARGTPANALINYAETHQASLIVVGNKRMKGLGRVLGSIANSVAHGAPCDVYIVNTEIEA
ncbi:universal stress protein [Paenarthrobacter sp. NPDC089322]|uniref:universal stress protein n=1 Tax=Paenarthrobacter sp. NPDC089322 TaxID=3155065 RepID=UPI003440EDD1